MEANPPGFSHKMDPTLKIADPPRVESSVFDGGRPVNPGSPRGEGCCRITGVALIDVQGLTRSFRTYKKGSGVLRGAQGIVSP